MFDVVIQGPVNRHLKQVIEAYRKPYVNKIIYSGWVDDPEEELPCDIEIVKSIKPSLPGNGNVNLQIQTSRAGLNLVTSPLVLKTRSDMCIRSEDLDRFYDFYVKCGKVLTTGISTQYALYTLDFIYFGKTSEIKLMFDCPFDNSLNYFPNYAAGIIPETHLTAWYISNFDLQVKSFCLERQDCLVLNSPGYQESLKYGLSVIENYFKPLPCIDILWTKKYNNYRAMREILAPRITDYYSNTW